MGTYMMEFEKEAKEKQTGNSIPYPSKLESGTVDVKTGFMKPETTTNVPQVPVEALKGGLLDDVENAEEALDFNLDEWFHTEDFLQDSIYGHDVESGPYCM